MRRATMGVCLADIYGSALAQRALLQMDTNEGVRPETAAVLASSPAQQMYIGGDKCKFDCAPANELDIREEFTRQNTNQEQLVWIFTASCGFYTYEFPAEEKLKAYWLCGTRANTRHADAEQNFTATVR
jgi:hypothetical protein